MGGWAASHICDSRHPGTCSQQERMPGLQCQQRTVLLFRHQPVSLQNKVKHPLFWKTWSQHQALEAQAWSQHEADLLGWEVWHTGQQTKCRTPHTEWGMGNLWIQEADTKPTGHYMGQSYRSKDEIWEMDHCHLSPIHCTLYTIHYTHTLFTIHYVLYTLFTMHYTHTLFSIRHTLFTIHHMPYIIHHTLFIIHYTPYIICHSYTLYIIHYTHYSLYIIHMHYTLYWPKE